MNGRTDVTPDERAFLAASDRDRRRTTRRLRGFVVGLATLLVVAVAAGVVAFVARAEADQASRDATSRQLAAESLANTDTDPVGVMRDAVESWHTSQTVEARGALLSALNLTYPSSFDSGLPQGFTVDVSADGRLVAVGSGEGTVAVWDLDARRRLDVDITAADTVLSVKFSPDASMLAVSSVNPSDQENSGVKIWSVPEGKLIRKLASEGRMAIGPVAWRPDGTAIASPSPGTDSTVGIAEWDPTTGNLVRFVGTGYINTFSLAYSPSGDRLASGNGSGRLDLWDPATGGLVSTNTEHARTARKDPDTLVTINIAFSPQLIATASVSDNTIRLWDAKTGALVREFADITRHVTDVGLGPTAFAFSPDGAVLYTNSNTTALTVWDPLTGSLSGALTQGPKSGTTAGRTVLGLAVSADGRTRVAVTSDGEVLRWRTNVNWNATPGASVTGLDFAPDGKTAVVGDADGMLMDWDVATGDPRGARTVLPSAVYGVRYTPDGVRIAGSVDATFTLTTTRDGVARSRRVHLPDREFRGALAVSPDGKLFAAAHQVPGVVTDKRPDYRVAVWDVATLEQRADLALGDQSPTKLAFSPDGETFLALTNNEGNSVVGSDTDGENTATMVTWRGPDFLDEERIRLGADALTTAVYTPDGGSVVTAGTSGRIQIRDAGTGALRDEFGQHTSSVREMAISPDGRTLATVTTEDADVHLWDLPDRRLSAVLTGHVGPLNEVVFSSDGKLLATGGTDTDVGVWQLDPAEAVRRVCANLADAGEESLESIGC